MSKIEWKYVTPLKDESILEDLEIKMCFPIPSDLIECVKVNNAGMPSCSKFDLADKKAMVFGGLLSFNEGDEDSFFDYVDMFRDSQTGKLLLFPFGLDPFGNFFCIKDKKVVFFDHESNAVLPIADTFTQFIKMLYS